jgi:hypothetical protein
MVWFVEQLLFVVGNILDFGIDHVAIVLPLF